MIHAMIFDLDGTLVQTEKLKALSDARAAVNLRPDLTEDTVVEAFKQVVGLSRSEVAEYLMARFELEEAAGAKMKIYQVDTPWQAFIQERLQIYERMLLDPRVVIRHQWPHNMALLKRARESCQKVGLATMSYCAQVQRVLDILDLKETFDFVASRDDVGSGKPDPEIYRLVSRQLGVPPDRCLVIEDSPVGVKSAIAAEMACIAVTTPFTKEAIHRESLLDSRWIVDDPARLISVVDQRLDGGCNGPIR